MAYLSTNLSVLAYANNFTLWHFVTRDSDITENGYFDRACDILRVNDLIIANVETDGSPSTTFYVVTANNGSKVSIAAYS